MGRKISFIRLFQPRLRCKDCGVSRAMRLPFVYKWKPYTKAVDREVWELSKAMTIQDVADYLGMDWRAVKEIQKERLSKKYRNPCLKGIEFVVPIECEDPRQLGAVLFGQGVHCVLAEGGSGLHGVLNDANLTDSIMAFIAPIWIGGKEAPSAIGGLGSEKMLQAKRLIRQEISYYEGDLLLEGLAKVHHPDFVDS